MTRFTLRHLAWSLIIDKTPKESDIIVTTPTAITPELTSRRNGMRFSPNMGRISAILRW